MGTFTLIFTDVLWPIILMIIAGYLAALVVKGFRLIGKAPDCMGLGVGDLSLYPEWRSGINLTTEWMNMVGQVADKWVIWALKLLIKNILTPCLVWRAIVQADLSNGVMFIFGIHIAMIFLMMGVGWWLALYMGWDDLKRRAVMLLLLMPNAGNMGIPVALNAFGQEAVVFAALYFAMTQLTGNTAGVLVLTSKVSAKDTLIDIFTNPIVISLILAIGCRLIAPPAAFMTVISAIAEWAIPLMLFQVGMMFGKKINLGMGDLKDILRVSVVRLLVSPLCALGIALVIGLEGHLFKATISAWAMPSAITTTVLAGAWKVEEEWVVSNVVINTALSMITVSFVLWCMEIWL